MKQIDNYFLDDLIGKSKAESIKLCEENGYNYRVVREDSNKYAITMDFRFDRINLWIHNGLITKCDIG